MSRMYVFEVENEKGELERKYVELTEEKVEWICRKYVEYRINHNLPI